MIDCDTDRIDISGLDETDAQRCVLALEDTAVIVNEQGVDNTLESLELEDADRVVRARTQPDWPPVPPPPLHSRSRRHKAFYSVVARPRTSSDA